MGKDRLIPLWDEFDKMMSERGFNIMVHNDRSLGRGSVAYKDDKFAPLFNFKVWGGPVKENFISIHVEDRNGHFSLDGDTAAIYSLTDTGNYEKNLKLLRMMVDECYKKFGSYCRENRLDFVFNELTLIRKRYDENTLEKESDLNEIIKVADKVKNKQVSVKTIKETGLERE